MQHPNGYPQGNYYDRPAGYEYRSAPQTQQAYRQTPQHPMVVIPSQPNPNPSNVSHLQAPYQPQSRPQPPPPNLYSHYPAHYQNSTQQQNYYPQQDFSPQFAFQQLQQHFGPSHQVNPPPLSYYPAPQQQQQYHLPGTFDQRGPFSPEQPLQRVSQAPLRAYDGQFESRRHPPSSPDPLQASPQMTYHRVEQSASQRHLQMASSQQRSQPQQSSTPQPRVFARVEIPASVGSSQDSNDRPQKRRKSNEGHAFPVPACEPPPPSKPQKKATQPPHHQSPAMSSFTELPSSNPPPQSNIDCQAVLLALADEYVTAAYSMSAALTTSAQQDEYCSLISTAMGCLESVLTHCRQSDHRAEARLRLRLATLMVEETENHEEAEQVLGKGIAICERSRLYDLKYAMHHLLVRLTFKTSPKAALKAIDKLVQEIEALHLLHWLYCFRFLRVSLMLQGSMRTETHASFKHLAAISATAEEQRDVSVQIVASVFEGIVHLRSGAEDAADMAQRAFAVARTHQLSEEMKQMPQISALLDCLDLCRCLLDFSFDQLDSKLQQVEQNVDILAKMPEWNKAGSIYIKLAVAAGDELEKDTCGIFRQAKHAQVTLPFQWITKTQLYTFAYALSGYTRLCKNSESTKAEAFFKEAQKLCHQPPDPVLQSLSSATQSVAQRHSMSAMIHLQLAFALCARFEWRPAQEALSNAERESRFEGVQVGDNTRRVMQYLKACCRHGLGELREALALYDSPDLAFESDNKMPGHERDIRLLAAMSNILISRMLGSDGLAKAESLVTAIEPHVQQHRLRAIKAAYYTLRATGPTTNNGIMKTKQYLQVAIDTAKVASNNQLLSIVMSIMTGTLYANIVGEQAEKSARAGVSLARKARHPLWIVVANGLYGNVMERCGKLGEAQAARKDAQGLYSGLPEALKQSMKGGRDVNIK